MDPPNLEFLNFGLLDFILIWFLYKTGFIERLKKHTKSVAMKYLR